MRQTTLSGFLVALLFSACLFSSCNKMENPRPPAVVNKDLSFYVLSKGKQLAKFNLKNLSSAESSVELSGMESGEIITGIDFRPATGQLYALGNTSRLYVVNLQTGVMRAVNTTPFTPKLTGTMTGFDFNPTVDRIRVVTNTGQNLRLNPETGTVAATDGNINGPAGATVTAVAYTNNKAGAATTVLYDIDVTNKKLYKQDPPNNGTLVEVGSLGEGLAGEGGFDISPDGTVALAVFSDKIYYIDLESGKATKIGAPGNYMEVTGLAIRTEPVAYAVDEANNLLVFNPENPMPVSKAIMGMTAGEMAEGIDFRPFNGQLYALGSGSRIYTINTATGAAAMVGTMPFATLLTGTSFGFDFNPTVDRIRVVSTSGQNLRLHPETGAIAAVDLPISNLTATVGAVAYTNNFAGATTTTLYDIDAFSDKLFKQDPPNNGVLVEVGSLGLDVSASSGFDIGGTSGVGYAILTAGGTTKIYGINLATGAVTAMSAFSKPVKGFAVGLGF